MVHIKKQIWEGVGWGAGAILMIKSLDLVHTFTIWWHPFVLGLGLIWLGESLGDKFGRS